MKLETYNENNFSGVCIWNDLFQDVERIILQEGFLLTGCSIKLFMVAVSLIILLFIMNATVVWTTARNTYMLDKIEQLYILWFISVIFSGWLSVTLLFTSLRFDSSYRNLANFTSVACFRRIVPTLLHVPLVKCIETLYGFQTFSCELFAFVETFLAVFEVECLTHVCIERYVLAKYITNGWQIRKNHYYLYFCLCVFFSCLYSIPPLYGIGRYGLDFQCTSCTFDVVLLDSWHRYFVVAIFVLRSVKPTIVMAMMLIWARVLESKLPCSMKHHQQFTRSVTIITLVNLLCWAPIAMIRGSVLLSQLMNVVLLPVTSSFYITWAMWIHWVAPAFTFIALFLVDDRVRYKLFSLCAPEHGVEYSKNE